MPARSFEGKGVVLCLRQSGEREVEPPSESDGGRLFSPRVPEPDASAATLSWRKRWSHPVDSSHSNRSPRIIADAETAPVPTDQIGGDRHGNMRSELFRSDFSRYCCDEIIKAVHGAFSGRSLKKHPSASRVGLNNGGC